MISSFDSSLKNFKQIQDSIPLGITFDDVLLIPQYSKISSRFDVDLKTKFSTNVPLITPIVSSPMDTCTEYDMAVEMARNGGLGIIHRFMSQEDQANMIYRVKNTEAHIIEYPITVFKNTTVGFIKELVNIHDIHTFLVIDELQNSKTFSNIQKLNDLASKEIDSPYKDRLAKKKNQIRYKLAGILTRRDLRSAKSDDDIAEQLMTKREHVVVIEIESLEEKNNQLNPQELVKQMQIKKVEKFPLVNSKNEIMGLVTYKDLVRLTDRPLANLDPKGQLYVGAAVGVKEEDLDRIKKLIDVGCDVVIVDIANGHSEICIEAVRKIKQSYPTIDVVAGSIATGEGAEYLIKAGANGIRCGIGNGSICITRVVAGAGVPQLSALFDVAPICKQYGVPLIADGGIRNSGHMCKALAAGAQSIMLGRLLSGCDESPSKAFYRDGKLVKIYRGMAGYGANLSKQQKTGNKDPSAQSYTPEGVEGYIPYAGPLKDVLTQFTTGIRSGMSYCGAFNIEELQQKAKFIRMTQSGNVESGVHDINKI